MSSSTPLRSGMKEDDPLPMDVSRIAPPTFVGEVVMKQEYTPFLRAAREKGCEVQVGTDMLFEMIPAYLEFFGFATTTPEELRAVANPLLTDRGYAPGNFQPTRDGVASAPYPR